MCPTRGDRRSHVKMPAVAATRSRRQRAGDAL